MDTDTKSMETAGTINVEPEWVSLVPLFIQWIKDGTDNQFKVAEEHLYQMARVCDDVRSKQKKDLNPKACRNCGSTEEPTSELEVMPDGSHGAGVVWVCPDCGDEEM